VEKARLSLGPFSAAALIGAGLPHGGLLAKTKIDVETRNDAQWRSPCSQIHAGSGTRYTW
jgi:hypothetical protein